MEPKQETADEQLVKVMRPGPIPFESPRRPEEIAALRFARQDQQSFLDDPKRGPEESDEEFAARQDVARIIIAGVDAKLPPLLEDLLKGEVFRFSRTDAWEMNAFMTEREVDCKDSAFEARSRYLGQSKVRYFAHQVLRAAGSDGKVRLIPAESVPMMDLGLADAVWKAHVDAYGNPFESVPKVQATR